MHKVHCSTFRVYPITIVKVKEDEMASNPNSHSNSGGSAHQCFRGSGTLLVLAMVANLSAAFAQNEDKVKAGMNVWKESGCAECHGSFADGEKQRDEAP